MENLTNSIAEKISSELGLDNDSKEVIAYGTFALIQTLLSIFLVVIFGAVFKVLIESLIVSFTISILRKYSGGAHASSPGICTAIGTIIAVGFAFIIYFIIAPLFNINLTIFFGLLTFSWSYYIILKLAPVDSISKPIKTQKKKERMKKESILVLGIYLIIVLINIIIYILIHNKSFLIFSICIYSGITWQTFTLTYKGHIAFLKIDSFFNKLLNLAKGER
ncbi:accessory gene regulator B [Clostridium sp. USBA 49]|uniref:accessory gene regulator ArgB-like protein n=1 Tax=Clostridium sp. USBA 49 TaxID=1881060 RepID=UPI00099A3A60|nr:accessory gene regulator B family protein [Clostridium sp. USBA 49]SKA88776.1 accessory gene regulator B [Clostridium sp. USBA 49]